MKTASLQLITLRFTSLYISFSSSLQEKPFLFWRLLLKPLLRRIYCKEGQIYLFILYYFKGTAYKNGTCQTEANKRKIKFMKMTSC